MSAATVSVQDIETLRNQMGGSILARGDPGYEQHRPIWNAMVDAYPALLVRVTSAGDIAAALDFARSRGLPVAVRGGGHNVAGNGTVPDGVVIDLSLLNTVQVLADEAIVRVGGGATLGDVDRATAPFGLAVPLGVISRTGVGGLALGGGLGWLTRAHGLTADNLLDARVVTVGGSQVYASEDPDLLWGLRGGGGNFGVVESFTFRAHRLGPQVYGTNLIYRAPRWRAALAAWEEWTRDLPDQMQSIITGLTPPPELQIGSEPVLLVAAAWAGSDMTEGERLVADLRAAAPPDEEDSGPLQWTEWQSAVDFIFPHGVRGYWKNASFDRLDDAVIDVLERRGTEQTWQGTAFDIHHMGGAFARVPAGDTPFPARTARFWLNIYGFWRDAGDDAARTAFVRDFAADVAPFVTSGRYVNFTSRDHRGPRAAAEAVYDPPTLARLVALKRRYDPGNLLRRNHNIPPD